MNESSCCSAFSLAFGVISVPDFGYSNRCVVISHYCFNLQFLDDIWHGASLHMIIYHLYIFFGEESITVFSPWLKCSCLFSYCWALRVLCMFLYNTPLLDVVFCEYILLVLWLVFSFPWYCPSQSKLLILMQFNLQIISFMGHAFDVVSKKSSYPRS